MASSLPPGSWKQPRFGASAVVASYAVSGSCGELTAPCHSEPELLTIKKHFPGEGWEDAECVRRRLEMGLRLLASRGLVLSVPTSLFMRGFVRVWERIGRLVKVSSAKISVQGK